VIKTLTLSDLFLPIQFDLRAVEDRMRETALDEQHASLSSALDLLLASGGKRVRPAVALLANRMLEGEFERAHALAAAIEMLHTATLVHDDLIDGSLLRRGMPTLNAQWSPAATVLTGDFLFARAADLASQTDSVRVMNVFARTLMVIVNGEINQLFEGRGQASRAGYERRIYAKTASLFVLAAEAGAILSDADEPVIEALRGYGRDVGMAFQIVDDILDFTGEAERVGKPVGSDLRQGLFTLPVLCYMEKHPHDRDIAELLDGYAGDHERVERVVAAVRRSGAIEQAIAEARAYITHAQLALSGMPDNEFRQGLVALGEYTVNRNL
jgi:geranylgeranyl pyrophosphate synthase